MASTIAAGAPTIASGRFAVRDGTVFHTVEVSTLPSLVGFASSRRIALDGDRLTLSGPARHEAAFATAR